MRLKRTRRAARDRFWRITCYPSAVAPWNIMVALTIPPPRAAVNTAAQTRHSSDECPRCPASPASRIAISSIGLPRVRVAFASRPRARPDEELRRYLTTALARGPGPTFTSRRPQGANRTIERWSRSSWATVGKPRPILAFYSRTGGLAACDVGDRTRTIFRLSEESRVYSVEQYSGRRWTR